MEETNKTFSKIFLKEPLIKKYSKVSLKDVQDVSKVNIIYSISYYIKYKYFKNRFCLI